MTKTLYLTALLPPAHVSHAVSRYQRAWFQRQGEALALFLQPHIPILFSNESPVSLFNDDLPPAVPCRTKDLITRDSAVFLLVDTGGLYEDLRRRICSLKTTGPYPSVSGILLRGDCREKVLIDQDTRLPLSPMKWLDSSLACLRVEYFWNDEGNPFGTYSECIFLKKLRRPASLTRER
ncbi:MAG: hypothetical protein JW760_13680 [Spirochaetales bacterium]|nr:hypothetical protein [Spirochaetales bacterium]